MQTFLGIVGPLPGSGGVKVGGGEQRVGGENTFTTETEALLCS